MNIILIIISITSMVAQNSVFNNVCKKNLHTREHIFKFNIFVYAVCMCIFGVLLIGNGISVYTVITALIFGIVTALSNFYKMRSLALGPMHITLLITTASMIIPTMSGVFFGETFSMTKLLAVLVLIFFIYLSLGQSNDKKVNKSWIICCILAFVFQGTIGVLQKIHQSSVYKGEINAFLCIAFACSLVYSIFWGRRSGETVKLGKMNFFLALFCGVCAFCMNYINMKLSGILPSQLFFPLVNGSAIVLSSLVSIFFFKEIPTQKQVVGLCGGILSLILICIVK